MSDEGKTPDINCDKRQQEENTKGEEQHRCIERKRPDKYLQIVEISTCEVCPLANLVKPRTCQDARRDQYIEGKFGDWRDELLNVKEVGRDGPLKVNPSEEVEGYEQPCPYRWDQTCRVTGRKINPEICLACDQETAAEMATLPKKIANYAGAIRRWIREGRPVRTDNEVAEILKICQGDPESSDPEKQKSCKLYDAESHSCLKCGCAVSADKAPLGNKLRMKSEICPLGLWH